jgi:hypothetical protein
MESKALEVTEAYSAARSAHPRVTLESMRAKIIHEFYFVLGDALDLLDMSPATEADLTALDVYTVCVLVLDNGWVVTGHSAPASPDNFDKEKGRTFAYEKAIAQLWPLEGYLLRAKLHKESGYG